MRSFDSFEGFALHLAMVAAEQEHNDHVMLEKIGQAVEARAKDKIGEYQPEAGPFKEWAELAVSTKRDRVSQGYPENEPLLRSGELRDSIEHRADSHEARIGSDSDIAVYQELGTKSIPPRSFLGSSLFELAPAIAEAYGDGLMHSLEGKGVFQGKMKIEHD